ncbi:MAG TPA: OB-fold domain-containing protein [Acidimicrobiia bacterium]|nr:OB-fold domain-containing protein [Acidimicrobiia bacterium]
MKSRLPAIDGWFTDEAEPRLIASRGTQTGSYFFPKSLAFSRNPSAPDEELDETTLSRTGRVWSWTTNHYQPPAPYVSPDPFVPYTVVAVELVDEQMVVLGPLAAGDDPADLAVGAPVELTIGTLYADDEHEYTMWAWRMTGAANPTVDQEATR